MCALAATPASGAGGLAELPNVAQKLTAYGGYVVFSQLGANRAWWLMAWHAGSITRLDVPTRSIPFDAQAGAAANGKPVVLFSKCVHDPPAVRAAPTEPKLEDPMLAWSKAVGCRIYALALPRGAPRPVLEIPTPSGVSDSTPAIWNGEVAFARHVGGSRFTSIYLWHPASRTLTRLGGGSASCPAASAVQGAPICALQGHVASTWVEGMSLDPSAIAYEWVMRVTGNAGIGSNAEPELRVDPLRGGHQDAPSQIVSTGLVKGTCGGLRSELAERGRQRRAVQQHQR